MQMNELKTMVAAGDYKPDPSRVAAAMLRRRGVRELLAFASAPNQQAGRSHSSPGSPPFRAA